MSQSTDPIQTPTPGARFLNFFGIRSDPHPSASAIPAPSRPRSSTGPRVHIDGDSRPRFINELTPLLRRRLRIITLVLAVEKILFLVGTLSFPLLELRVGLIVMMSVCYFILRSSIPLSMRLLRWFEFLILAMFFTQATSMPDVLIIQSAKAGDFVTATMDYHFVIGAWAVFIIMYGVFIPNTWQRAAAIILPFSCIPAINFYLLGLYEPTVRAALSATHHGPPIPLILLGAVAGIHGAHSIYSIRQGVFKAKQLGRYRLGAKLGAGGMGEVYRAHHDLLKRPCAIKLIRPGFDADPSAIIRFEREVQATCRLSHPNTIEIYDYGRTDEGVFYYVMELLKGISLQDMVARFGPMPPARAAYLLKQVCGALGEAHALGLIHRDLKPANIFAARLGAQDDVAKLMDFGLVKSTSEPSDASLTQEHSTLGSPYYMSPEQATGNEVDARTDLYSLGAIGYFLVTGRPPFTGQTQLEVIAKVTRDKPQAASEINSDVRADFDAVLTRCLEKRPEKRFQNVAALKAALDACEFAEEWTAAKAEAWWRKTESAKVATNAPALV